VTHNNVKFFPADFSVAFQGKQIPLRGLLSELGITRVVAIENLPSDWKNIFGKTSTITLDQFKVPGVMVQHFDAGGACTLVRFFELGSEQRDHIRKLIDSGGVLPGWQRKLPRIPVESEDPDLPLPSLCTLRFAGQEVYVEVKNFTLGGLGVKAMGTQLADARVGTQLQLDLITTRGDTISNFSAEIMNISVHDRALEIGDTSTLRFFGLRKFCDYDVLSTK